MITNFPVTRIYSDAAGETHFEDIDVPMKDAGKIGFLSEPLQAKSIIFREVIEEYEYDFHNAPQKQYILLMDGEIEIETSLGDKRVFVPGKVLLVEDITGKGHRSRNLTKARRKSVFVTF